MQTNQKLGFSVVSVVSVVFCGFCGFCGFLWFLKLLRIQLQLLVVLFQFSCWVFSYLLAPAINGPRDAVASKRVGDELDKLGALSFSFLLKAK